MKYLWILLPLLLVLYILHWRHSEKIFKQKTELLFITGYLLEENMNLDGKFSTEEVTSGGFPTPSGFTKMFSDKVYTVFSKRGIRPKEFDTLLVVHTDNKRRHDGYCLLLHYLEDDKLFWLNSDDLHAYIGICPTGRLSPLVEKRELPKRSDLHGKLEDELIALINNGSIQFSPISMGSDLRYAFKPKHLGKPKISNGVNQNNPQSNSVEKNHPNQLPPNEQEHAIKKEDAKEEKKE